jgi:hypothetical protein
MGDPVTQCFGKGHQGNKNGKQYTLFVSYMYPIFGIAMCQATVRCRKIAPRGLHVSTRTSRMYSRGKHVKTSSSCRCTISAPTPGFLACMRSHAATTSASLPQLTTKGSPCIPDTALQVRPVSESHARPQPCASVSQLAQPSQLARPPVLDPIH